ncbi:DUF185-domain-containing protein [Calocera viscosa TUFC12733]|uniref:Protein arginine methyltransferase NDUFAF7 n=1 Tax=Calocera viscosa (strain TUFC12733) TaxID=1330018 RepID=A0A167R687_CALVF|nr:DUF185-domain-containing protein [Calocera viscosa TUFC12733]
MRCYVNRLASSSRCRVHACTPRLLSRWNVGNCASLSQATASGLQPQDTGRVITPVEKLIAGSIKSTGPISIARYMQFCLGHPIEGYYMKRDVFGEKGDFITSPEISQTFGELLAVWFMSEWERNGRPARTRLVELGSGRGTLLADMLRTFSSFRGVSQSLTTINMVENSRVMRELQKTALQSSAAAQNIELEWHDDLEELEADPNTYTMLVAHEFFDAMPIHMLEKAEDGWREVMVDLLRLDQPEEGDSEVAEDNKIHAAFGFRFVKSPPNTPLAALLSQSSTRYAALPNGSRIEVSPQGSAVAQALARLIGNGKGGAAMIIDYGDDHTFGSSLRAFRRHKHVDLFDSPGECDITANVDFAAVREAVEDKAHAHGPITQRHFLMSMGLVQRLDALLKAAETDEHKMSLAHAARRLVDSTSMGSEYKFMAITSGEEIPYPFEKRKEDPAETS